MDIILSIIKWAKKETILIGGKISQHYIKTCNRPILRAGRQEGQIENYLGIAR